MDRPGFGLSDPVRVPRGRYRDGAIEFIDEVLDALELESPVLAGASGGGLWALWYALARPERVRRLVLLTAVPTLPGTHFTAPLRMMVAPLVGDLARVKPSPAMVVQFMAAMGEKDTIVHQPDVIESLVAAGRDPIASTAALAEYRAVGSPLGFRDALRVHPDDLRSLNAPTLVIWGDRDPDRARSRPRGHGEPDPERAARSAAGGHVPWLGTQSAWLKSCPGSYAHTVRVEVGLHRDDLRQ